MNPVALLCAVLVTLIGFPCHATDGFQAPIDVEFQSQVDGSSQRYVVLIPENFDPGKPHDVLIALHGHGSDRWQFVQQDRPECRESRRVAAESQMLFVSPDYRATTSWMGPAASSDMLQILDHLQQTYRLGNVVLCGGSMGGTSALAFAAMHPESIDGVVSLNGTANMLEYDQFQDAIQASYGGTKTEQAEVYRMRSAELFPERLTMPIATTTGGLDTLVPPHSVLRLTASLQKQGSPVNAIHRAEGGHETNAEDTREALSFVLETLSARRKAMQTQALLNTRPPGAPPTLKVVCLGDSVTGVYYHTGGRRAYPEMLQIALSRALPDCQVTVINAGISGHTTKDGLARLDQDVLRHAPDVVSISFGLNDLTRIPQADFRSNLDELIRRCRASGARVVLCTPNAVLPTAARPVSTLEEYCDILRRVAAEQSTGLCDQYAAGNRLKQRAPTTWRLTLSDEIHPNMDGHKRMAEELCFCLTGQELSLSSEKPAEPFLQRTRTRLSAAEPIRVLIMKPLEPAFLQAIKAMGLENQLQVTVWETEGKSLSQLQNEAQALVRPLKPDLVLLTFPNRLDAESDEQRIHAISWIMNWSLDFGKNGWDCAVVYPVNSAEPPTAADRALVTQLVSAQDLPLITTTPEDNRRIEELFQAWLNAAVKPTP